MLLPVHSNRMLCQMVVCALVACGLSPCVLQRGCPARAPRPPSSVCMHHLDTTTHGHARAYKEECAESRARVFLQAVLRMSLAELLLRMPLRLYQHRQHAMTGSVAFLAAAVCLQMVTACKNCVTLGKEEKAMFRAHSEACLPQSQVDVKLVDSLLNGELSEEPALKRHVYCVLMKCKVVGKDGKLLKTAVLGKLAVRSDGRNASKILEHCAEQSADSASSAEEVAWNLFRCGYERKAVLFDYMPVSSAVEPSE